MLLAKWCAPQIGPVSGCYTRRVNAPKPSSVLPDVGLRPAGAITSAFVERGATDLRASADLLWHIPYGRNAAPGDLLCVLAEGVGTCSTKHALLARLIAEQAVPGIELRMGIYEMSEANTPGVGATLADHGLTSLPEAHCYLVANGVRVDITRTDGAGERPIDTFLAEEAITADQIGDHKRDFHRRFLATAAASGRYGPRTPDELWAIREQCIRAISI